MCKFYKFIYIYAVVGIIIELDGMCLLCGTEWIFKQNQFRNFFKFNQIEFSPHPPIMPLSISHKLKVRPQNVFQTTAATIITLFFSLSCSYCFHKDERAKTGNIVRK